LTPGGSSIHLHTNNTQNTEDGTYITITTEKKQLKGEKTITRIMRYCGKKYGRAGQATDDNTSGCALHAG
jgi:hypothetical protein